ncbi:DJ-1/PfpI family protein (plasmid) [Klebsiella aerogenes]|uniref:DJ-1/PfpI family protein n=1 Tax=Klebsiella aerogenes TaxID=548 RepID=UPI002A830AD5|nr:DJ-1/PfpI family protein [Klebsiella aerogenes]WPS11062.1 DJ-1/PfpI family protein [Klebsiella aerogenes]
MSNIKSILFLAFPNISEQDLLAAWELMRSVSFDLAQDGNTLDVGFGSFDGGVLPTHMGAHLQSERIVNPEDRYDLIYVPGGLGAGEASKDKRVLDLIRAHHQEGRWVGANCAGVGVLYRAGVLDGLEITSPASLARRLPSLGANVMTPRRAWKIDKDNRIFTSGGAATVHPSTIALTNALIGSNAAYNLANSWDSRALHGDILFNDLGPVMQDDPVAAAKLQDQLEMVFLPD